MSATELSVVASKTIDAELAEELRKHAAWVARSVRDLRIDDDGRTVRAAVDAEGDVEAARAKLARFVTDMIERHRPLARKIVARRGAGDRVRSADPFAELARRGWIRQMAPGRVSLRGPALSVAQAVDRDCARIASETFGAEQEMHPALAPAGVLARCGWFGSFPHAASFVAHLAEDYDTIDRFRRANAHGSGLVQPEAGALAPLDSCLLPALCYAVYGARERTRLAPEGCAVTCAGRCFRYESRNVSGIERLWEFAMREIVLIGDDARVESGRSNAIEAALAQLERWGLQGVLETANDPFFPAARAGRAYWQRAAERKLELHLPVGRDPAGNVRTVACASFNLHDRFFGNAFEITTADGVPAASACAGWGIERWTLACFAQHGFDPEGWPEWLRERVFH